MRGYKFLPIRKENAAYWPLCSVIRIKTIKAYNWTGTSLRDWGGRVGRLIHTLFYGQKKPQMDITKTLYDSLSVGWSFGLFVIISKRPGSDSTMLPPEHLLSSAPSVSCSLIAFSPIPVQLSSWCTRRWKWGGKRTQPSPELKFVRKKGYNYREKWVLCHRFVWNVLNILR